MSSAEYQLVFLAARSLTGVTQGANILQTQLKQKESWEKGLGSLLRMSLLVQVGKVGSSTTTVRRMSSAHPLPSREGQIL